MVNGGVVQPDPAVVVVTIALLALATLFRVFFVKYVGLSDVGYKYDRETGRFVIVKRGYHLIVPWATQIYTLFGNFVTVEQILTSNRPLGKGKLVQFNEASLNQFIQQNGVKNYDEKEMAMILSDYYYDGYPTERGEAWKPSRGAHFYKEASVELSFENQNGTISKELASIH